MQELFADMPASPPAARVLVDGMNLESLLDSLNNMLANPMRIIWTDNSLRFLLLFVMVNGWTLLIQGLIRGYI